MAKVTAPLLSFGAAGQIGSAQVYASWKGRAYARRYVTPSNPNTTAQQETRSTFRTLNSLWRYMPSSATAAWELYGRNSRFTARNGWLKQNISALLNQTDLTAIVLSPAAGGGIAATSITVTPGDGQVTVDLTAPVLPVGWTITAATAVAVRNIDPQSSGPMDVVGDTDTSAPWSITLTGLTNGQSYVVGGWFSYEKPDGQPAYGVSMQTTATPTA